MKKRRFVLGAMAALLLVSTAAVFAEGGREAAAAGEPVKITWMSQYPDSWFFSVLEEKFNVEIESNGIYVNDSERVEVMLATGEFPDVGPLGGDAISLYQEGITRPIPKEMIRRYAPEYTKIMDQYPLGWITNQNPENEDELLCFNGISENSDSNLYYIMVRSDWLSNVGVDVDELGEKIALDEIGVSYFIDADITTDWLTDTLKKLRDGDPDQNGINDTAPWGACNQIIRSFCTIFGAFGSPAQYNSLYEGELYDWRIHPRTKDTLEYLAGWYEDNLIDKEFVTDNVRRLWEKVGSGLVGMHHSIHVTAANLPERKTRPPRSMLTDDALADGASVLILPPPIGPNGDRGGPNYRSVGPVAYRWYVNADVSDEKLKTILEVFDYSTGNTEGYVQRVFGKPGVHFKWEGEPWESAAIAVDKQNVPDEYPENGGISVYPPMYTRENLKFIMNATFGAFTIDHLLGPTGKSYSFYPYRWDEFGVTGLSEVNERYGSDLSTLWEEMFFRAVTGEVDIDAEWDGYVAKWLDSGGNEYLTELGKAPIVSELQKGKFVY